MIGKISLHILTFFIFRINWRGWRPKAFKVQKPAIIWRWSEKCSHSFLLWKWIGLNTAVHEPKSRSTNSGSRPQLFWKEFSWILDWPKKYSYTGRGNSDWTKNKTAKWLKRMVWEQRMEGYSFQFWIYLQGHRKTRCTKNGRVYAESSQIVMQIRCSW